MLTIEVNKSKRDPHMTSDLMTAENILAQKGGELFSVALDATVHSALAMMLQNKVGSMLVKDENPIFGIYTERDLMRNSIEVDFNPKTARIGDHMSKGLKYAPHTGTGARANGDTEAASTAFQPESNGFTLG